VAVENAVVIRLIIYLGSSPSQLTCDICMWRERRNSRRDWQREHSSSCLTF